MIKKGNKEFNICWWAADKFVLEEVQIINDRGDYRSHGGSTFSCKSENLFSDIREDNDFQNLTDSEIKKIVDKAQKLYEEFLKLPHGNHIEAYI